MTKVLSLFWICISIFLIVGCEQQTKLPKGELAVKVNNGGVGVAQVNYELFLAKKRNPNLDVEKAAPAALEQLINQELLAQKSVQAKNDQNDAVKIAIDRARKRILAQAYLESQYVNLPEPTEDEIKAYFENNPALFSQRRVYQLQQFAFSTDTDATALEQQVKAAKDLKAFTTWLSKNKIVGSVRMLKAPAEKLPMVVLNALQAIPDGKGFFANGAKGPNVVWRVKSELQPVTLEVATPKIKLFLIKKARQEKVKEEIKSLRSTAKLEYMSAFRSEAVVEVEQPLPVEEGAHETEESAMDSP